MLPLNKIQAIGRSLQVADDIIEKDYCLTWLLTGLAGSPHAGDFVFYGGTALKKLYFPDYRFSEDLDLIAIRRFTREDIELFISELSVRIRKQANILFSFDAGSFSEQKHRVQFFVNYDGYPEIAVGKAIKFDLVFGYDHPVPPVTREIKGLYADMKAGAFRINAYSLEMIAVEKILTILTTSRNEPRDIYDLWSILKSNKARAADIKKIFHKKNGYVVDSSVIVPALQNPGYAANWENRLGRQMRQLPAFGVVKQELISLFKEKIDV